MPIIPGPFPNEAYELALSPESFCMAGWYTVTCNSIPVHHFAPPNAWDTQRYCCDPEYRLSLITAFLHGQSLCAPSTFLPALLAASSTP
jgi:hypothetical protein